MGLEMHFYIYDRIVPCGSSCSYNCSGNPMYVQLHHMDHVTLCQQLQLQSHPYI